MLVLSFINFIIIYLMIGTEFFSINMGKIFGLFILGAVVSFFVIHYLLEKYVFRKIKLIYKIIHKSKVEGSEETDVDIKGKSLESVNNEVIAWAEDTEEQLRSLKTLANYRKNFVGNVSHELKTPIFSIQGYLHTLLDGGIHDDAINIKFIKRAAENAGRLKNIVDDLESISKLESGELILDFQKFDIRQLTSDVFEDLRGMAKKRAISLKFGDSGSQSFSVLADKNSIRRVLTNLLVNSMKYSKEGGTTTVNFYDMEANILIEVADDGIGIAQEHHKYLFDRF